MSDIEFIDGLNAKAPRDGAPDFVKASISIKREDLIAWLASRQGDWINADLKESRNGKLYFAVNNWKKPEAKEDAPNATKSSGLDDMPEDLPF